VDEGAPTTSIQLRLADGSRMVRGPCNGLLPSRGAAGWSAQLQVNVKHVAGSPSQGAAAGNASCLVRQIKTCPARGAQLQNQSML